MKKIIHVARVVPKIEKVFREKREAKIAKLKRKMDEGEKNGANLAKELAKAGLNPSYLNLTPEEKEQAWRQKWDLPRGKEKHDDYEDEIANNKKINNKLHEILAGIEKIQTNMDEDRKHWQASEERRQLHNMRTERGIRRIFRGGQDGIDQDPVQRYKESLESLVEVLTDIKNK